VTKLKFEPTARWKTTYKRLKAEAKDIPSLQKVDLYKVANDLFLDKVTMPTEQLEAWLSQATEVQAEKFVALYMEFWNQTPRKALNGQAPDKAASKHQSGKKEHPTDNQWAKISDLLLTVQGNFQAELYEALDTLPQKSWKPIIDNVHRLFERYYYTVIEEFLPDQTIAPADLVESAKANHGVLLPRDEQILVRLFRSPGNHHDVHKQIRMTVGQESLQRAPLMLDLVAQNKKSQVFPHDYWYNQCLAHLQKQATAHELPAVVAELWRFCALGWRSNNAVLKKAFNQSEWLELWQKSFTKASTDWQTTDDMFEIIIEQIHEQVAPMNAAVQQLQAPKDRFIEPLERSEFLQYMTLFDIQASFSRLFLSPLITYLPLLEVRYVEPLNIAEEVDDFTHSGVDFVAEISKPPSYFRLRVPAASELWQEMARLKA
jgi:hypothetical protein